METDIQEKRQKIAEVSDKIDATLSAADDQGRALTDEERSGLDAQEAEIEGLKAEIDKAEADLARRQRQEERKQWLTESAGRLTPSPAVQGLVGRISFPECTARPKRVYQRLKSFTGEEGVDQAYRCGLWLRGAVLGDVTSRRWLDRHAPEMLAMGETADSTGGALVPEEFMATIIALRERYGVFRANARVVSMGTDTKRVPRRTGGLTVYAPGENASITKSDMSFDMVQLIAQKLATLTAVSNELLADEVIGLADIFAAEVAYAFAKSEDDQGFLGDGTSTYFGTSGLITECGTATATTATAATGNTAFSTLDLVDFEDMIGLLPQYADTPNTAWYISKVGYAASMMRLMDAGGGNTIENLGRGPERTFLGYPVRISQSMNSTTSAQTSTDGLCYFGDLSLAATLGDRTGGVLMEADKSLLFDYDQTAIRAIERIDINVHDVGDTSNAGAMVMLATPAS